MAQQVRALAFLEQLIYWFIMENTKQIGNLTELQCTTYLYEIGCAVSIPFGNSEKYDLIIDYNNKLFKVQIKHSSAHFDETGECDYISFNCRWQGHNANGYTQHQYTSDEVDYFATYYNNKCYLVPQKECSNQKILRIKLPKNGQKKGISFLENYKAEEVLKNR